MENSRSEDSIETQIAYCKDYIASQADLKYGGFFDDIGYTGTNFNRPRYSDMMGAILAGEIKCVVVKDLSRLGRTYIEVGELLFDTFLQLGVRFISANDNYDSFAPDAGRKKLLILVKNLKNSQYSKDLGLKIKSVAQMKQKNGEMTGSIPPYGYWYSEDRKSYRVIPEAAEIVRLIFELHASGMGKMKIAERLNAEGRPTPRHHYYTLGLLKSRKFAKCPEWLPETLCRILDNEAYTGCMIQGKTEITADGRTVVKPREEWLIHPCKHQAIISSELFDAARETTFAMRHKFKNKGNSWGENIFAGKLYCSRCGHALARQSTCKGEKLYFTYRCCRCSAELKRAGAVSEKNKALRLADMETLVFREISCRMDTCLEIDAMLNRIANSAPIADKRRALTLERDRLIKESGRAVDLLTAAYAHHVSGLLDESEFCAARAKFEDDKQKAQAQLTRIEAQIARYDADKTRENGCLVHFRKYRGFKRLDKGIIGALIKRIEVTPVTNDVAVTFNFKDSYDSLTGLLAESGVKQNVF